MIEFEEVSYKNFQSIGNHWMKIQLNRSPTTIIAGQNGAGKSTVLEAISYALFGKPLKKVNLAGLINTTNKKGLEVQITWTNKGKKFKVIRGQKPGKLEFYIDDELLDQSAKSKDYQSKIEYHLGMDFKLFTQIVVLNKEKYVPFMELTAPDRRKVVEDILDISVFGIMSDLLKTQSRNHSNEVDDLKYEREKLEVKIAGQQRLIDESMSNTDGIIKDLVEAIDTIQADLETKNTELDDVSESIASLSTVQDSFSKTTKKKGEFEKIAFQFNEKIKSLNETISFFADTDVCPTCNGAIEDTKKDQIHDECKEKIDTIKSNSAKLVDEYKKVVEQATELEKLSTQRTSLLQDQRSINQDIKSLEQQITSKGNEIEKLKTKSKSDSYQSELDALQAQFNTMTDDLEDAVAKENDYKECQSVLKDDGIKAAIVGEYIDFINLKMNEYMNAMEFHLNITLDDQFNESINSVNRTGFTYDNLSSGQKCRVNLALWLALLEVASIKNSVVTNILILDEVLEPIDTQGVGLFMNLVKEKLPHKSTMVVTQRYDEFKDNFRSELVFKLNGDFTELV